MENFEQGTIPCHVLYSFEACDYILGALGGGAGPKIALLSHEVLLPHHYRRF